MTRDEILAKLARGESLAGSDLRRADLRGSDLSGSNLRRADLRGSDLRRADLNGSDLRDSNLSHSDLRGSDLNGSDLSGATGLPSAAEFLAKFDRDADGVLVFKRIHVDGHGNTEYLPPAHWTINVGEYLVETVSPNRCTECGSGVNFGTKKFTAENYTDASLWLCRIEWLDLADVVVPFGTDGKARCRRLRLVERIDA